MADKPLQDTIAFGIFLFGGLFLLWYQSRVILTFYYPDYQWEDVLKYFIIGFYLAFQIYANMYKLKTTNIYIERDQITLISSSKSDHVTFCDMCNIDKPPRSHHCKLCQRCVTKRDHHCWFAGSCIGYQNHRYYFVMVTHMVLAGLYCNFFNYQFVVAARGPISFPNILWFLAPHVGWAFGFTTTYEFVFNLLSSAGFIIAVLMCWLLCIQITQLRHGQTKYEHKIGSLRYNNGSLISNVKEVLGQRYILVFIFPFIESSLPGNGISFDNIKKRF